MIKKLHSFKNTDKIFKTIGIIYITIAVISLYSILSGTARLSQNFLWLAWVMFGTYFIFIRKKKFEKLYFIVCNIIGAVYYLLLIDGGIAIIYALCGLFLHIFLIIHYFRPTTFITYASLMTAMFSFNPLLMVYIYYSPMEPKSEKKPDTTNIFTRIAAILSGVLSMVILFGEWIHVDFAKDILSKSEYRKYSLFDISNILSRVDESTEMFIRIMTYAAIAFSIIIILVAFFSPRFIKHASIGLLITSIILAITVFSAVSKVNDETSMQVLSVTANPILLILFAVLAYLSPKIKDGFTLSNARFQQPASPVQTAVQDNTDTSATAAEKMICTQCGSEILDGNKFCGSCGAAAPQKKKCQNCGYELENDSSFCGQCGHKVK